MAAQPASPAAAHNIGANHSEGLLGKHDECSGAELDRHGAAEQQDL
jgi:hypothetical protein